MSGAALEKAATWIAIIAVQAALSSQAAGQTPEPLAYRRVYVPEESLANQIRGLLPLKRDEFERRLALAAKQADPSASQAVVRIEQATFRARLDGEHLKDGEAELDIVATAYEPSLLSLEPFNVALESAIWQSADRRAAVIGADPGGMLRCLVEQSGILRLNWTQAATQSAAGTSAFDLRLPAAPRRRMKIEALDTVEISVNPGLIVGNEPHPKDPQQRIWTIEMSGHPQVRLHARQVPPQQAATPLVVVREATKYNVLQSILDVETSLTMDVLWHPLKELTLNVERGLQITTVRLDDQSLPFRFASEAPDGPTVAHVELPTELAGTGRVVEIEATGEWPMASGGTLPRIKLADGLLQEGRVEIHAPTWLRLQARPVRGCVQTEAAPAAAGRTSDRLVFQLFEPDAAVEISLNQAPTPLREESGTQINVESSQVTGVLITELTSAGSARFSVEAQVPRQWIIDAVETQPPEMVADRSLTSRGQGPQLLHLNLARPITAQRPLRLVIRGHCRRPANDQQLGDEFFRLASFPEVSDCRRLVATRVNDPSAELRLTDDENLSRLDPSHLTPAELRLFENTPGTLLLEPGPTSGLSTASLRATTARYRVGVLVRADVERGAIQQTVSLHCQPEASSVGSIVVRLSPRPRGDVTWRLAEDELRELPAVLDSPPAAPTTADEAVYRLLLPRPRSSAFEAIGQWTSSQSGSSEISLASLPAATRQTGLVEIHSPDRSLRVRTSEVQSLPQPPTADDRFTTLCGRYRYEAGRRHQILVEPMPSSIIQQSAWIETLQLTSHFSPDGSAQHEATFTIQNSGAKAFRMRLPSIAGECRLVMDGAAEEALDMSGPENTVLLSLPPAQRRASLRVRYCSKGSTLGMWPLDIVAAPIPHVDLPVLTQTWHVLLHPGLATVSQPKRPDSAALHSANADGSSVAEATITRHSRLGTFANALSGPALASRLPFWPRRIASSTDAAFAGWSTVRLELPRTSEATLWVYRPAVIGIWSLCLGLAAVAVVFWLPARGRWIPSAAGLLAAIAIACQSPLTWLLGGAGLGLVAGGILLLFRPRLNHGRPAFPRQTGLASRALPAGPMPGVVILCTLALASCLVAAPPEPRSASDGGRPRVVFPIGDNQQPAGDYLFLDGAFYDALHRAADAGPSTRPAWLLESAHYHLPAAAISQSGGAAVEELHVAFDFHTFQATTVHLPLRRDQILLLEGRARLDGQPVTLAWEPEGRTLSLPVAVPGKHRLELAFGASAQSTSDAIVLDIAVPPAAKSAVALPAGSLGVKVDSTGASGRLSVRWPSHAAAATGVVALDADQLLWWKMRPGSAVVEGRFRLRPLGGAIREAVIEVDPRLRLLPGLTSGPIGGVKIEEGTSNLVKVELAEPATTEVQFRLAWLWPDASGMGTLLLPRAALRADRLSRDWTVVSAEPKLEIDRFSATSGAPSPAEFAQVWPDANIAGSLIVGASVDEHNRAIVVRPAVSLPHLENSTDWSVSGSLAQVVYTALLTDVPTTRYEHRLMLPSQVKVSRVAVTHGVRSAAIRWIQQPDGVLIVSLLEPPAVEQTLTVAADLALPHDQTEIRLPIVALEKTIEDDCVLRIYRQNDVQLRLRPAAGWSQADDVDLGKYRLGFGRLTAALRSKLARQESPGVSRAPNQPHVTGAMFTRVDEADGDWRGEVNLNLVVSGGVLDELRLSVPEEWSGPLEIEPAMEQRLEASSGELRRQIVLRPREAVSGSLEIKLRGPIHGGASGVQAPDVALVGEHVIERFVLLDRGSAGEQIDWEMSGLLAAGPSGAAALPTAWRDTGGDLFRVVGPRFDATARTRQTGSPTPRVHLADLRAVVYPGRRIAVTAAMTVQPLGAHETVFSLPSGCRLVQALVDDVPAPCTAGGLRTWKVPAPSDVLPYRLTITYDTYVPADAPSDASLRLAAPLLVGMEVEQSLWTVEHDDSGLDAAIGLRGAVTTVPTEQARACSPSEAELTRLQAPVRALEAIATAQGTNLPPSVLAESFVRWGRALATSHQRLLEIQDQGGALAATTDRLQAALDEAARVRQRLVQSGVLDDSDAAELNGAGVEVEPATAIHFLVRGNPGELQLTCQAPQTNYATSRSAVACYLAATALLLGLVGRSAAAREWLMSHGTFVMGIVGVAWWLLAPLGWLGWIPMLAAVWCTIRSPWPRSRYEAGSA